MCDAIASRGMSPAVGSDIGKVWAHLTTWMKVFGIKFEVIPVVSCSEFASMWPGNRASAKAE